MNNTGGPRPKHPSEDDFRWDYLRQGGEVPPLSSGQVVLVRYFMRPRLARVGSRVPGGVYWARLLTPVSGSTRVLVTKNSLIAVARNEE
jgi:hypothetical protein